MAEIKRLHYYDHQYLREPDFTAEQSYHKEMRYRHNRSLHTYGVVHGLTVAGNGVSEIEISAGMALDSAGRELVLEAPVKVAVNLAIGKSRFVIVKFTETRTDAPEEQYRVSATDRTRWTEKPEIELSEDAPEDVGLNLVLGTVTRARNSLKIEDGAYPNNRRYSGASGEGHFSKVGKVGIGTSTPNHELDVNGNINYNQLSKLDVADNFTAIVRAADFKLGHSGRRGNPGRALVDNKEALVLNFGDDWAKTEIHGGATYIKGNVGIGATNPGVTLDVNGDLRVRSQKIYMSHDGTQNSNNDYISYDDGPHLGSGGVFSLHSDVVRGAAWDAPSAALSAKGGYFSGKVGIGTDNPGAKLEINSGNANTSPILGISTPNLGDFLSIFGGRSGLQKPYIAWKRGPLRFGTATSFGGGNFSEKMRITADGKVGIGNSNPFDKLTIKDGDVRIEGGRYRRLKIISDKYWAGIELVARQKGEAGHPHIDFTHGELDDPNYGVRLYAPDNDNLYLDGGNLRVDGDLILNNRNNVKPSLGGSDFYIGWNWSGGRGETVFYQHGGGGWRSGFDFYSSRDGSTSKKLLARIEDTGNLNIKGGFGKISDGREKTNIEPISNALKKVINLKGIYFNWKEKTYDSKTHIGLIAQEVLEVVPEVVVRGFQGKRDEELYCLQYEGLIPLLVEALKEQQQIIGSLTGRLSNVEAKI